MRFRRRGAIINFLDSTEEKRNRAVQICGFVLGNIAMDDWFFASNLTRLARRREADNCRTLRSFESDKGSPHLIITRQSWGLAYQTLPS